ncbi:MAG: DUF2922 domain-containing protein [Tissierellia bacterium]|nr:DUF2922 domain-containing protein [Tissierellia bacterium]
MEKAKLEMEFLDSAGKKFKLTIDEPRDDITDQEIKAVMDDIIARDIFFTSSGNLVSANAARIIRTTTEEMEF